MERVKEVVVLLTIVTLCSAVEAGPPLPLHSIEGTSGVHITSTACLGNVADSRENNAIGIQLKYEF